MSALRILTYPEAVLRRKAFRVGRITPDTLAFAESMIAAMNAANGLGLAAPQVGVPLRIIVLNVDDQVRAFVNPQIIAREGAQTDTEGCLSLPHLYGAVTRAQRVTVQGRNERGKRVTLTAEDLLARAVQHEIDHLDGVLFIDRIASEPLSWITGEKDEQGELIKRPTSLADALWLFEEGAALARA